MELPERKRGISMVNEHPVMSKAEIENVAKKWDQPVGVGGKNPHTIKPPPPLPTYNIVKSANKRSLRLSKNPKLQSVSVEELLGAKVIITGKKGKMIKVSGITKPK